VNEFVDLERFADGNQSVAEEAFSRMKPGIERFLRSYLSAILPLKEDLEDVIVQAISKIWLRRSSFTYQGMAQWWSYVGITGRRCALSKLEDSIANELMADEIPVDEWPILEALAQLSIDRRRLYEAADQLWLSLEPSMAPNERKRRLLAAQMVYLHGVSTKDVANLLGGQTCPSRKQIDAWLESESTLLDLAYHTLFWENSSLTAYLLRPNSPLTQTELETWVSQVECRPAGFAPNGMSWDEVGVIVWRYLFGMGSDKIALRSRTLSLEFVEEVIARTESQLPYAESAARLCHGFSSPWVRSKPLANPGLWKRLVFQYWAQCELPHRQILHRTKAASEIGGKPITEGMLNVWLSNGRLFAQLARYAQETGL